jgi:hypothetical protein
MATAYISTSTELTFLNTTARPGVIIMPSTNIPGRILTFKDRLGTFNTNSITFSTPTASQLFETGTISLTYNDPFGSYSFITGQDNKWYTIGGNRMSMAFVSTINTINLNSINISSANVTTSTLQFKDTSTRSTQTAFYQSTNMYYSSPVSFFVVGPTKAPKSLFVPTRRPFQPNQVSGLSVWLDAADTATTITTVAGGTSLTQWRDKSTNLLRMSQATLINMPTIQPAFLNGNNVVGFTTSQNLVSLTNLTLGPAQTFFVVFNPVTTFNYFFIEQGPNTNTTPGSFLYGSNADLFVINRGGVTRLVFDAVSGRTVSPFAINNWYFCSFVNSNVGLTVNDVYWSINGTRRTIGYNTFNNLVTGDATNLLYLNNNGRVPASNYYAEILIFNSAVSLTQVYQVEGYLAWKWGLAGNLPATHPFKYAPP